jgi:hypothetical protein
MVEHRSHTHTSRKELGRDVRSPSQSGILWSVKVDDLKEIMGTIHVDAAKYGINRDVPDGLCIRSKGEQWRVYRLHGEVRTEERTFASENDACVYFLLRVLQLFVRKPATDGGGGSSNGGR